jgi:hypothetical protein
MWSVLSDAARQIEAGLHLQHQLEVSTKKKIAQAQQRCRDGTEVVENETKKSSSLHNDKEAVTVEKTQTNKGSTPIGCHSEFSWSY